MIGRSGHVASMGDRINAYKCLVRELGRKLYDMRNQGISDIRERLQQTAY
jgi:hypothetical protein